MLVMIVVVLLTVTLRFGHTLGDMSTQDPLVSASHAAMQALHSKCMQAAADYFTPRITYGDEIGSNGSSSTSRSGRTAKSL